MKKKIFFFVIAFVFASQIISALTANSSSYSLGVFGTGIDSSYSSSSSFDAISLSVAQSGTRNADSNSYTANVGFFENTPYYVTVSVSSYSISPKTAVVGSTISLSISALNAQSVWAKIISPNGQEQIVSLVNNQFVTYSPPSIAGRYNVTLYANSSTGAIASVLDYFELTEQPTTTPSTSSANSPGGGGASTTTIIEKTCNYIWDCTPWSLCSGGLQKRECGMIGECAGIELNKPREEMECSEALFDVSLKINQLELTQNRHLIFNVALTETFGNEKIDVHVKYSLINKEGYEIFSQIETKAIQGDLSYQKKIDDVALIDGEYTIRVDVLYGNLQRAFAEQSIKVVDGKIGESSQGFKTIAELLKGFYITYLILFIIPIAVFFYYLFKQKKYSNYLGNEGKEKRIKRFVFFLVVLLSGVILFVLIGKNIFGRVVEGTSQYGGGVLFTLMVISVICLLIVLKNKVAWRVKKNKLHLKNNVRDLLNKKVYSANGNFIGKVEDVLLGQNRIESLKIRLDKKGKFDAKGAIVNYRYVKGVNKIVIIDGDVLES